jgi:copper transport protein
VTPRRVWAGALWAACALALAAPAGASAHAILTHTTPHQDAAVARAPAAVQLDFNEAVEAPVGAVRVFDRAGARVDAGNLRHPGGRRRSVAVDLRGDLGRGVYTATYRVVSADGHPVSGGFAFGVGEQVSVARGGPAVADLLAASDAGPAVEGAYGVARGLHYAALLLLVGAGFFAAFVARPWPVRLLAGAACLGAVAALAALLLQGALATGAGLGGLLSAETIEAATATRAGEAWGIRAGAWAAALALLVALPGGDACRPRARTLALALPAAVLVASLPYGGHAGTQSPQAVLVPADVVHVLAAGAWLGGLVLLLALFWPRHGAAPADGAAEATARFSRLALPAIVTLVAAGLVQAWFYLGSVGALVSSTYGWALLAKLVLLAGVVALAAGNRRRAAALVRGAAGAAGAAGTARALRRAMAAEVALAALVLAATATLVRATPPATERSGPVVRELDVGPLRLQMDVEPAVAGPNDWHLYFFDRRTGAQVDRVKEVRVRLTQPEKGIGPLVLTIPRKDVAHYELLGAAAMGVPGTWRAQVDVRLSEFDQYTARTEFDVRSR